MGIGMSLTKDQHRNEIEVQRAISRADKKFITLCLLDNTKNRIQGAMVLHATPYLDHLTNMKQYHFEERGGPLQFIDDELRGGSYCRMLDCEHNRRFLASMHGLKFWEIESDEVLNDIIARAAVITKNAIITRPSEPKETKMSDADIETEMARLQAESSKRKIAKSEAGKRKPTPEPFIPPHNENEKTETTFETASGDGLLETAQTNPLPMESAETAFSSKAPGKNKRKSNLVSMS